MIVFKVINKEKQIKRQTDGKMMKPILAELEKEYQGRANIISLEINDYRDVANQYQVRVIPTQVFFDKQGNQIWRHQGFLAKEDIVKKLKELGAE